MHLTLTVILLIFVGFSSGEKLTKWPNQEVLLNRVFNDQNRRIQESSRKEKSEKNIVKDLEPFVGLSNAVKVQKCLTYQLSCNDSFWNQMEEMGGNYLERFFNTYERRRQIGHRWSVNSNEKHLRNRRSLLKREITKEINILTLSDRTFFAEALDKWLGIINLSGWRTAFFPARIYYDFFGDKRKKDREELEKLIEENQIEYERLEKNFQEISDEHEQRRYKEETNYNKLKTRYEKDLRTGLLGLNKKYRVAALKEICTHATVGRKFCL